MINVFQNEKEYTISVTKKVNFSETPSKRDFKKFAEEVFDYSRSSNEYLC